MLCPYVGPLDLNKYAKGLGKKTIAELSAIQRADFLKRTVAGAGSDIIKNFNLGVIEERDLVKKAGPEIYTKLKTQHPHLKTNSDEFKKLLFKELRKTVSSFRIASNTKALLVATVEKGKLITGSRAAAGAKVALTTIGGLALPLIAPSITLAQGGSYSKALADVGPIGLSVDAGMVLGAGFEYAQAEVERSADRNRQHFNTAPAHPERKLGGSLRAGMGVTKPNKVVGRDF